MTASLELEGPAGHFLSGESRYRLTMQISLKTKVSKTVTMTLKGRNFKCGIIALRLSHRRVGLPVSAAQTHALATDYYFGRRIYPSLARDPLLKWEPNVV